MPGTRAMLSVGGATRARALPFLRCFSMPSRADTSPFALEPLSTDSLGAAGEPGGAAATSLCWIGRSAAGAFDGPSAEALRKKMKRAHALSPLLSAEALLRSAAFSAVAKSPPGAGDSLGSATAAAAALAEQTLSLATLGTGAGAWVLREGTVLAMVGGSEQPSAVSVTLKPGDVIALFTAAPNLQDEDHAAGGTQQHMVSGAALCLKCTPMAASEVWSPLGDKAPHRSWVQTVFNEYGDHSKVE